MYDIYYTDAAYNYKADTTLYVDKYNYLTDYTAPTTYVAPVSPPKTTTPTNQDATKELAAALDNLSSKDTSSLSSKKLANVVAGIEGLEI